MLDRKAIENCLELLGRTQLVGNEVPAFVDLTNRLQHLRQQRIDEEKAEAAKPPDKKPTKTPE